MTNQQITVVTSQVYCFAFVLLTGLVFGLGWAFLPLVLGFLLHLGAS